MPNLYVKMVIKKGDKIKVDYTGTLEDGTVFDSTAHGDHSHPLEFEVGAGQLIKGFDAAVVGMKVGEEKEITLKPSEAYGEHRDDLIREIPRDQFPKEPELKEGMNLVMQAPNGMKMPIKIAGVTDTTVKIDLNPPLAGKILKFKIKILEVN